MGRGLPRFACRLSKGDLENVPAGSLLCGVYFMWAVRIYERRFSEGELESAYHLAGAYGGPLLGDTGQYARWMVEGLKKGYAPCVMEVTDNVAAARLWYRRAMTAYYLENPGTELGVEMLRRGVLVEDQDAEFEQAKLWIQEKGTAGAGLTRIGRQLCR